MLGKTLRPPARSHTTHVRARATAKGAPTTTAIAAPRPLSRVASQTRDTRILAAAECSNGPAGSALCRDCISLFLLLFERPCHQRRDPAAVDLRNGRPGDFDASDSVRLAIATRIKLHKRSSIRHRQSLCSTVSIFSGGEDRRTFAIVEEARPARSVNIAACPPFGYHLPGRRQEGPYLNNGPSHHPGIVTPHHTHHCPLRCPSGVSHLPNHCVFTLIRLGDYTRPLRPSQGSESQLHAVCEPSAERHLGCFQRRYTGTAHACSNFREEHLSCTAPHFRCEQTSLQDHAAANCE
jgi:hypothetical protein